MLAGLRHVEKSGERERLKNYSVAESQYKLNLCAVSRTMFEKNKRISVQNAFFFF